MLKKLYPISKYLLGWPLAILSLFFVLSLVYRNSESLFSITKINLPLFLLGIFTFLIYFFVRVFLWKEILGEKGRKISFKEMSYLWGISEFKRYTPGNIWSFISRHQLQKEKGIEKSKTIKSLILEAELIVISTFFLSISALNYFLSQEVSTILLFLFAIGIFIYIFSSIYKKRRFNFILFGDLSLKEKTKLISLSIFNFFLFALGSYLVSSSVFSLNLKDITFYIGIFSFSLLAGYVSFITPMGLGVREGIVVIGLSKLIPTSVAALISIFSRVSFILSELIFLSIVIFWNKTKSTRIKKIESFVAKHKFELVLLSCILIYVIYFTTASFLRHDNFYTGRFDLGNMDQVVWNTTHGRMFQMTNPDSTNVVSRLAFHADFILILLSPFYFFFSTPKTLLFIQSLILGLGAFFVYLISLNVLKKKPISLVFATSFLLYPALGYTNLYDFHPVTLATTFILISFYFLIKKSYLLFILFLILASITKEQIWLVSFLVCLYFVIKGIKERIGKHAIILGVLTGIVSLGLFYYLVVVAIPNARGGEHFALEYYSEFGSSPVQIVKNTILDPAKTISLALGESQIGYMRQLFMPLAFTSFLAPEILIFALPDLGINLLSSNQQLHQIYYQYSAVITPFIFISAIYGVYRLKRFFPKTSFFWVSFLIMISSLYSLYITGPLPLTKQANIDMFTKQNSDSKEIQKVLSSIPDTSSVSSSNNLGPHLSHRQYLFTIPVGLYDAEYIAFLHGDSFAKPSPDEQIQISEQLRQNPLYEIYYEKDNFIVFRKKYLVKDTD